MELKWNRHVLILYDKHGDEKVAAALKAHFEKEFDPCDVVMIDSESYSVSLVFKLRQLLYKISYKYFRHYLAFTSKEKEKKEEKRVQELVKTGGEGENKKAKPFTIKRILNIMRRFEPVMVLCTNPEALDLTLIAKNDLAMDYRTVGVISQFALDASFVRPKVDGYFVENPEVKKRLMNSGVIEERIAVVGYPTTFSAESFDRQLKRKALGLTGNLPLVVVNGGDYDTYTLKRDVIKLMEKKNDYYLMIIAKDKKLRKYYTKLPEFSAGSGLMNDVLSDDILDAADILVTVPDTSAIFGAFMRGVPVILADGVTSLENQIKSYLVKRALVIPSRTPDETLYGVYEILDEPFRKNEFKYRGQVYVRLSVNDIHNITPQIENDGVAKLTNKTN